MKHYPTFVRTTRSRILLWIKRRRYHGRSRQCPVCGEWARAFARAGAELRFDAQCYFCGAMERHRLLWIFLSQRKLLDGVGKWFLHIAPEPCLFSRFEAAFGTGYVAADLMRGDVAVRMDIEKIPFADEQFDSIYCSHVLEHVVDDKAAMIEFHRVLRRSGWAILLVPITAAKTFENPTIVDPVQRRAVFGQEDHVRRYGPDYVHRLRDAGFIVEAYTATDIVGDTIARALMGLTAASGEIYFCRKS